VLRATKRFEKDAPWHPIHVFDDGYGAREGFPENDETFWKQRQLAKKADGVKEQVWATPCNTRYFHRNSLVASEH
jgi:hypothetical protein